VPSRASEFAHPDVIIGLSVLAYRYEGMRSSDFEHDVIELLRSDFEKACGPYHSRKPALQYRQWVEQAGGAVLGMSSSVLVDETDESKLVVPLWLLKASNERQMSKLFGLLRKLPAAVLHMLEHVTFPAFMHNQRTKRTLSRSQAAPSSPGYTRDQSRVRVRVRISRWQ
jgi:hypothetical protein